MDKSVAPYADLIGKPFKYGGRGPDCFDCYGLLVEMNKRMGTVIPDYVSPTNDEQIASMIASELPIWTPCERIAGAAVALRLGRYVSHVGFMLSADRMIHVWERSGGVCVERMYDWERRVAGFYRIRQ